MKQDKKYAFCFTIKNMIKETFCHFNCISNVTMSNFTNVCHSALNPKYRRVPLLNLFV